jgi:hypothetical protein
MGRTARHDVAPSQCHVTLRTEMVDSSEVIPFAQQSLPSIRAIDGKEFGSDDIPAILRQCDAVSKPILR